MGTLQDNHATVAESPRATKPAKTTKSRTEKQPQNRFISTECDSHVLLAALQAMRDGDFTVRLPGNWTGIEGKIADTFNEIVATNGQVAGELKRVGQAVGHEGETRQRMRCDRRQGSWGAMEFSVNSLIEDLLWPTNEVTRSIAAVAKGDLSQTVPLEIEDRQLQGEFLRSARTVNTMINQMNVFTLEVTRVAREVSTEGKFGGQAIVPGVAGTWRERLLDETTLFLHCDVARPPEAQQKMLQNLYESNEVLVGRKVLVVDDDVRNIFALSSILERHHINMLTAYNSRDAIELIERTEDLALVLMDIMMPEMDGYETMRQIRAQPRFNVLPIIALTAKAMKGDREKCLEAGASEYVAKPVNSQQLVGLLRTWLHR